MLLSVGVKIMANSTLRDKSYCFIHIRQKCVTLQFFFSANLQSGSITNTNSNEASIYIEFKNLIKTNRPVDIKNKIKKE